MIDEKIEDDGSCGGFKHCMNRICLSDDPECQECIDDAERGIEQARKESFQSFKNLDTIDKIHDILLTVAEIAYKEGRQHQMNEDFPDVGMEIKKTFKDTNSYKGIMSSKK